MVSLSDRRRIIGAAEAVVTNATRYALNRVNLFCNGSRLPQSDETLRARLSLSIERVLYEELRRCYAGEGEYTDYVSVTSLSIPSTDGSIRIADKSDIFTGFLADDFRIKGHSRGPSTRPTKLDTHVVIRKMLFHQLFRNFGRPFEEVALTEHQIVLWCEAFIKDLRLINGKKFLFLCRDLHSEYFIVEFEVKSTGSPSVVRFDFHPISMDPMNDSEVIPGDVVHLVIPSV